MPIPKTRQELRNQIMTEFQKLDAELKKTDDESANVICIDEWSIKDIMAVRLWWTRNVLNWIDKGKLGEIPELPAAGYNWNETPRLNENTVDKSRGRTFASIVSAFRRQYSRLLTTIDELDDDELLKAGFFEWAGTYPVSRWLSINTVRQYHTARTLISRTRRKKR